MKRCSWVNENNELYVKYHDQEWGRASRDDNYLFEMLLLENFQAGLSWECILNKRQAFKEAFDNFDYRKIAKYGTNKINELLNNEKIIRNNLKIKGVITNAVIFMEIQKEYGSFAKYIWYFTKGKIIKNKKPYEKTKSPLSDLISKDLQKRGMKFVGSTIIYSYLQAIGIINDHEIDCEWYNK